MSIAAFSATLHINKFLSLTAVCVLLSGIASVVGESKFGLTAIIDKTF